MLNYIRFNSLDEASTVAALLGGVPESHFISVGEDQGGTAWREIWILAYAQTAEASVGACMADYLQSVKDGGQARTVTTLNLGAGAITIPDTVAALLVNRTTQAIIDQEAAAYAAEQEAPV